MKNLDYSINYASATFSVYGHYKVEVLLQSETTGDSQKFYATTTDMRAIDEWKSIEDLEEGYKILFDCIEYEISDEIIEWLYTEQISLKEETYLFENVRPICFRQYY